MVEAIGKNPNIIYAHPEHDPGARDLFGKCSSNIKAKGGEKMANLKTVANDQGLVVSDDPQYEATDHLFEINCSWKIGDHKRNYVLIIEDMQYSYEVYIKYRIPHVKKLVDEFRAKGLPIVWTNWRRYPDDGMHGAIDRFYGSQGVTGEENPCYVYGENPTPYDTVAELAPQNDDEFSRMVISHHLSKFADYDEEGREILFPMLEAWGVNTIVLCGAWTDDCLCTTVFDAIDKYGYDLILVNNGCATATVHGGKMMECLYAATSCNMSAEEIVQHLKDHPELIEAPKAELNGRVRF